MPAVIFAGLFNLQDLGDDLPVPATVLATALAFASGYVTIRWLLRLVASGRLAGFVGCRVALAIVIIGAAVAGPARRDAG